MRLSKTAILKTLVSILLVIVSIGGASAQCDSAVFRNAGTFVYDMTLLDSSKMIAVGDNGYVIKSTDGGKNWRNIPTFQPHFLKAIFAATDSVLYTVGHYKTILKSEDQGESWFPLYAQINTGFTNLTDFFNDVYFFNKDKGFIVGDEGHLISTTDGGRNWRDTSFQNVSSDRLNCITFVNDTLGFICGTSNTLFKTTDGGSTWQKINMDILGFNRNITKVRFLNTQLGFGVGDKGLFMKTIDGGINWTVTALPTGAGSIYFDLCFINPQIGFVGGTYTGGVVLKTTDGGNNWYLNFNTFGTPSSCYTVATDPGLKKIVFAGGGSAGDFLGYNGRNIISTIDSGATYQQISANGKIDYYDTYFLNDSTGYISGQNGIAYKTSDRGESWKPLHYIPATNANPAKNIFFVDEQNGYASTDEISRTNDGGASWTTVTSPDGQINFLPVRIHFFDSQTGIVANTSAIYRTVNGGNTWSNVFTAPLSGSIQDFCFTSNGKGYAVGYDGKLFISNDAGLTWNASGFSSSEMLFSVYFYNNNIGFIGTQDSILYKTTDGGITWTTLNLHFQGQVRMRSFFFVNDTTGYLVRCDPATIGPLYKTQNAGVTWMAATYVNETAYRISGKDNVYVAAGAGLILKTDKPGRAGIAGYIYGPAVNCANGRSIFQTGPLPSLHFNWTLSGGGTNSPNENIDTVSWGSAPGNYTISVTNSNACGAGPSRQISVMVNPATAIVSQPTTQSVCPTDSATFRVSATGLSLSYQWKRAGNIIPNATGNTYKITTVTALDTGVYSVVVTGLCGIATSLNVRLKLLPPDSCVTAVSNINSVVSSAMLMPNWIRDNSVLRVMSHKNVPVAWTILDASGREIIRFNNHLVIGENRFDLSLRYLPKGFYYLRGSFPNSNDILLRFVRL